MSTRNLTRYIIKDYQDFMSSVIAYNVVIVILSFSEMIWSTSLLNISETFK